MSESKKITADLYTKTGEKSGTIDLPGDIFGLKVNPSLIAQAIRVYRANQRRGTASAKRRGEVSGGGRKPWRQKGTGRARHGSTRSPIWVKGGVAHGPLPKSWSLKMSKKMKKKALFSALSAKLQDKGVRVIEEFDFSEVKTKKAKELLGKLNLSRSVLVVVPEKDEKVYLSFRNVPRVDTIIANQLHVYGIISHDVLLIAQKAIPVLEKTFSVNKEDKKVEEKAEKKA